MTAAHLLDELAAELTRTGGPGGLDDGNRSIAAVLAVSYRHLTAEQQAAFRLVGLHPGTHLDPYALAALADTTTGQARRWLGELERSSLVNQPTYGRHTLHDLVRIYAAHTAGSDPEPYRQAALDRLFDHYTHTATLAMDAAYPYETDQRPRRPGPHTPTPTLDTPTTAGAWLDGELDNLLTTTTHGHPDHTGHLSTTLHRHLLTRGRYTDAETLHTHALRLAQTTGNPTGEQNALNGLGDVHLLRGRYGRAADCFGQALVIARDTGHRNWQFEAYQGLGRVHHATRQHDQALTCHHTALELATDLGQPPDQARAHDGLACAHLALGHPEDARHHWQTALTLLTTHHLTHTWEPQVTTETLRAHLAGLDQRPPGTA